MDITKLCFDTERGFNMGEDIILKIPFLTLCNQYDCFFRKESCVSENIRIISLRSYGYDFCGFDNVVGSNSAHLFFRSKSFLSRPFLYFRFIEKGLNFEKPGKDLFDNGRIILEIPEEYLLSIGNSLFGSPIIAWPESLFPEHNCVPLIFNLNILRDHENLRGKILSCRC